MVSISVLVIGRYLFSVLPGSVWGDCTFLIICPFLLGCHFIGIQLLIVKAKSLSCVRLFATPWTIACQDPSSMGFSRQEYRSGLSFPSPGDLPDTEIEHCRQTFYHVSHRGSSQLFIVVSYDSQYFCGVICNFPFSISNFTDLNPLPFFP